jgi:hypothetical protein
VEGDLIVKGNVISNGQMGQNQQRGGYGPLLGAVGDQVNNPWREGVASTDIYYSAGKVGIGTNAPGGLLEVYTPGANGAKIIADGHIITLKGVNDPVGYGPRLPYVQWVMNDGTRGMYLGWGNTTSGNRYVDMKLENSFNLAITGGNVGVGTTTPLSVLHIKGNQGSSLVRFDGGGIPVGEVVVEPTLGDRLLRLVNNSSLATGGFDFFASDASYNTSRLRIQNNGNIGIGTTTPSHKLSVTGSAIITANLDIGDARNSNSSTAGLNIHDPSDGGTYTNIQLAQRAWSGSHAILFNAYKTNVQVNGSLATYGNTKHSNDVGAYSNGAGMIHFWANGGGMEFFISGNSSGVNTSVDWGVPIMKMMRGGAVGIGTSNPDPNYKLSVNGKIKAHELYLITTGWSDFVFSKDYKLRSLQEVEQHIKEKGHLPDIPSEKEVVANGVAVVDMQAKLLQKIEELTLYVIEQDKINEEQKTEIELLRQTIVQLEKGDK